MGKFFALVARYDGSRFHEATIFAATVARAREIYDQPNYGYGVLLVRQIPCPNPGARQIHDL